MSEAKWTPGPWSIHKARELPDSFEPYWEIRGLPDSNSSSGWGVTNVHLVLRAGGYSEGEANAHLIAAAPSLYDRLEESNRHLVGEFGINHPLVKASREALAKARGIEPWQEGE